MSDMVSILFIYGGFGMLQAFLGLLMLVASSYWQERQDGARLILSCPIWPIVWLRGLWRGFKHVIDEADLPSLRKKS